MSTSAVAATPAATALPNGDFTRLPSVILQKILAFANTVTLAATSKNFKEATEALIEREWRHFDLNLLPNIQKTLASQKPASCRDLQTIYDGIRQKCTGEGNLSLAIRARNQIKGGFSPSSLQKLEDAARQAESNRNLELIWPRIVRALPPELHLRLDMNSAQIKHWLNTNSNRLATIEILNLSNLNLTMIPEEFSSLNLPNLTELRLYSNRLTTLPANFGNNWIRLEILSFSNNRISALPTNFGSNWIHFRLLRLNNNQIRALSANFGINWNGLHGLYLHHNQISALPTNFGSNWNQLEYLSLSNNQISTLPANFGANWAWWSLHRNDFLAENPILAPPPAIAAPPAPAIVRPTLPPIVPHIPSASPYQKLQKALTSAATVHVLSTVTLTAIASYAIGWKLAGTIGATYLAHRFVKGYL